MYYCGKHCAFMTFGDGRIEGCGRNPGNVLMLVDIVDGKRLVPRRAALPDSRLGDCLARANRAGERARAEGSGFSVADARQSLAALTQAYAAAGPLVARIVDGVLPGSPAIPIRLYDPAPGQSLPACVYLHGGGHMAGSIVVYDPVCRHLAVTARCRVVAVEYRLAPEHPYPAGLDDCVRALGVIPAWLDEQGYGIDRSGVFVAGDSGGGALTATLAARLGRSAMAGQILFYPSLDYTLDHPSVMENGAGYLLDIDRVRWYFDHYLQGGEDRRKISPLYIPSESLPPALIVTAGFCPLRDEAYAYAKRLRQEGTMCEHLNLPSMVHAFLNLHDLVPDACRAVYEAAGRFMRARS